MCFVQSARTHSRIKLTEHLAWIYDNSPTDNWPTWRFTGSVFSPTADSPTRPLTNTTSHKIKKKLTNSLADTHSQSYYSWKLNDRKLFCQPQSHMTPVSLPKMKKATFNYRPWEHFDPWLPCVPLSQNGNEMFQLQLLSLRPKIKKVVFTVTRPTLSKPPPPPPTVNFFFQVFKQENKKVALWYKKY